MKNAGHERASGPVPRPRHKRAHGGRDGRSGTDEKLTQAARLLRRAERPLRVLRLLAWPPEVAERFFADGARELPRVRMRPTASEQALELIKNARARVRGMTGPSGQWLRRQATAIEGAARMLAVVGTPDFFRWSKALYGAPDEPLWDRRTTSLELAHRLDRLLHRLDRAVVPPPARLTPTDLAERMRPRVASLFADATPEVVVVDHLSAKAVAGMKRIRIHGRAPFTEADLAQLVSHEAMIHVATKLNGRAQRELEVLASGHPGTTRTQEGLAVFSELITGAMTPARFRRLSNRVLAIQMSIDGADFLDVYRFFLERTDDPSQSFEDARRVFRGGVLTGGAPCTKDNVYLDGLLRVHNFLRVAVELGRVDAVPLLFCGRLDLEDIPALTHLRDRGLCRPPRFLPPWAANAGFLVAYLAYSGFLNGIGLPRVRHHYRDLLRE